MGLALIVCVAVASLSAQSAEPIFGDTPQSTLAAPAVERPYVVRSRTVALRVATLARAMASPATAEIALNLFDDATFAVSYERVEDSGFGHRSWVGHLTGRPLSTVTLTQKGDLVTGLVTDGTVSYEILGLGGGLHRIDELDTTTMPRETDVVLAPPSGVDDGTLAAPALASPAAVSTVDIFVFYTSTFRMQIGGTAQAQSRAAQHIAEANLAYQRSGVRGQLRLVGTGEIAFPDPVERGNENAVPRIPSGLETFAQRADVQNQREASQADLVALLANSFTGDTQSAITCGIGYIGPSSDDAFTVTARHSACRYTFAHEVGHNLGAQHAPNDPVFTGSGFPDYARGYKAPNRAFRTVMAYDCDTSGPQCPRVLNFSDPNVFEGGQPTGTATQHNARRLNELFPVVASYRAGAPPPPLPSAPRNLQAFINGASIVLSWQPPLSGTPTSYHLAAGTMPGSSSLGEASLTSTQFGPFSLPNGRYYARVYALNAAGSSPASNELPFDVVTIALPGPPRSFTASVNGSTVGFTWLPPSTGGAAQDYVLEAGSASGAANIVSGVVIGGTAASFPGIPQGLYFVRLRARNSTGLSGPSNEAIADVGACAPPSAPQNPTYSKEGSIVGVFWGPPAIGGPNLTYVLEAGSASGAADVFNSVVGPTPSISARVAGGTYFVRVRARTSCGTGPASGELEISVP